MRKGIEGKYGKLNENYLVVLRHKAKSNKVELSRVPVKCTLEYSDNSGEFFYSSLNSIMDVGENLYDLKDLGVLDYQYNYCDSERLDSYTEKFKVDLDEAIEKFEEKRKLIIKENERPTEKDFDSLRMETCAKINSWFKVYSLEETYNQLNLEPSIIMYSHRIRGWNSFKNKIDDNFSIEINTNFGYGTASYFYTKLIYKGLNVVKFTDWIYYKYASLAEMIDYSSTHELKDESWYDAINYVSRAYNTYVSDEKSFIRQYIIEELDKFLEGLEILLRADEKTLGNYKFLDKEKKHYDFNEDGHNIIEFKGRKMSGALDFIPTIKKFGPYTEANNFIKEIEELCRYYFPLLPEEVEHIDSEVEELNNTLLPCQLEHDRLTDQKNKYHVIKNEFHLKELKHDNNFESSLIKANEQFMKAYPEYKDFLEKYKEVTNEYQKIKQEINLKIRIKSTIIGYIDEIERKLRIKKKSFFASPAEPIPDRSEDYPSYFDEIPLPDIEDYPEFYNKNYTAEVYNSDEIELKHLRKNTDNNDYSCEFPF